MSIKIESLTGVFISNTIVHMRLETEKDIRNVLESNILDEIDVIFYQIEKLSSDLKSNSKTEGLFPRKRWENFKKEKWGYKCLVLLRELKDYLENLQMPVSQAFIDEVQKYHKKDWQRKADNISFQFSHKYYDNYKNIAKHPKLSGSKIDMLAEGFIGLFFSKNQLLYRKYLEWMKNIENYFCLKEDGKKIAVFEYTQEEFDSLKNCVDDYSKFTEFNRDSFVEFVRSILYILDEISSSRLNDGGIQDEEEYIRTDIENFYNRIFSCPEGTIGIVRDEIDNMLWRAANDMLECYSFLKNKKKLTWKECEKSSGFRAFMRYRLYFYLSTKSDNEFIKKYVNSMVVETRKQYGIYISNEAQISNQVFIEENCHIEKCRIEEDCHIKNCHIEEDVILHPRVKLLADNVLIKKGSIIESDFNIKGPVRVIIDQGNNPQTNN
ncbi:UDP-3-O-(3-hydroxymyristoyl)glucosamine N-acyltransferase [Lachnospiraceae bacterium]|nr:UDP-3-O-(3-hydroxymyristoyl)glucosamine N-acyltransferase [Lachnospiraceae bacterium]